VGDISKITGIPVASIVKLFEGKNLQFNQFREEWRTMGIATTTQHRRAMIDLLPEAHTAVKGGLQANDVKTGADTAFKLFRDLGLGAKSDGGGIGTLNLNFNQQNNQYNLGEKEMEATHRNVTEVVGKTKELAGLVEGIGDFTRHLLRGEEALPTPESQLKVIDAEPLPPVEDTPREERFDLVVSEKGE
jgi:hypothetical protein